MNEFILLDLEWRHDIQYNYIVQIDNSATTFSIMGIFATLSVNDIYLVINELSTSIEQHTLKNVNNCLDTNIYSYLETSGGQISNLYLNVIHFFNTNVSKTSVAA